MRRLNENERRDKKLFVADDEHIYNELFAAHRYVCVELRAWSFNPMNLHERERGSLGSKDSRVCKQREIIDCAATARALVLERYQDVLGEPMYLFGRRVDWGAYPLFLALSNTRDKVVSIHFARLIRNEWTGEWLFQTLGSECGNIELEERPIDREFPAVISGSMHQCLATRNLDDAATFCIEAMSDFLAQTPSDRGFIKQRPGQAMMLDLTVSRG